MKDVSLKEFEINDDFNLHDFDGRACEIMCLATTMAALGDEPDKDFEYYDVQFDNGVVLHAISGHHLEEIG